MKLLRADFSEPFEMSSYLFLHALPGLAEGRLPPHAPPGGINFLRLTPRSLSAEKPAALIVSARHPQTSNVQREHQKNSVEIRKHQEGGGDPYSYIKLRKTPHTRSASIRACSASFWLLICCSSSSALRLSSSWSFSCSATASLCSITRL